jgi:hypothetical protein
MGFGFWVLGSGIKGQVFSRSQAPAWERRFYPKLCLGTSCNLFKLLKIAPSRSLAEKVGSQAELGNQDSKDSGFGSEVLDFDFFPEPRTHTS